MPWFLGYPAEPGALDLDLAAPLVGAADIEEILQWITPGWPRLRIVVDGGLIAPGQYLIGSGETWQRARDLPVDVSAVRSFLRSGAMVTLDQAEQHLPGLGRRCTDIRRVVGVPVWANVYLNTGSGGFDMHEDDHDVLVAVVEGLRRWTIAGVSVVYGPGSWLSIPEGKCHQADLPAEGPAVHVSFAWRRPRLVDGVDSQSLNGPISLGGPRTIDVAPGQERLSGVGVRDADRWPNGDWEGPVLVAKDDRSMKAMLDGAWRDVEGDETVVTCIAAGDLPR